MELPIRKPGRPRVSAEVEAAILKHLAAGVGINRTARLVGVGNAVVQRVRDEAIGKVSKPAPAPDVKQESAADLVGRVLGWNVPPGLLG
jgi:hypothetical protein